MGRGKLLIWCNAEANTAHWLAKDAAVTAGSAVIVNKVVNRDNEHALGVYKNLANGSGPQNSEEKLDAGGKASSGEMSWQGTFSVNEAGSFSRWDVTVSNFASQSGGDCTAMVYAKALFR